VLAQDLAAPYPTVRMDTPAREAARLLAERHLPGLIVVDENDHPVAILPGSQVLRVLVPSYVQDDPTLARVLEEEYADRICEALTGRTVADMLPSDRKKLPVVAPDDTALEIAAIMAANRSPLVAVVEQRDKSAPLIGVVTASDLLERLLQDAAGVVRGEGS
jgi:CBS-domain-containing membrane protein